MNYLTQNGVSIEQNFFGRTGGFLSQLTDLGKLASLLVSNAMIIAGIILLFFFIFGGISLIAGAGSNNPEQAAKGKQAVTTAVVGFIIVFAAYWIVKLIETLTGVKIL